MADWVSASAAAATAVGTLVLAVATFASVRSGQRAARATEAALLAGIRPVLVPSGHEDRPIKIAFIDSHTLLLEGGQARVEVTDDAVYMALSIRNVGNGLAVLDRWDVIPDLSLTERTREELPGFRRLTRDIYVPAGDVGFWQGALRDPSEPLFAAMREAVAERRPLTVDILYGDHDGGQRTVSRFGLRPLGDEGSPSAVVYGASVARHWNLDRPDPRRRTG